MRSGVSDTSTQEPLSVGESLLEPRRLALTLGAQAVGSPSVGRGIAYDSRSVRPGDVFFALPGASGHGIVHAAQAMALGAAFVVTDQAPHDETTPRLMVEDAWAALETLGSAARQSLVAPVVGVTGSAGKTTTKTLTTAAVVGRSTPGNLNTVPALVAALVEGALMDNGIAAHNRGALVGAGGPGSAIVLELGIDRLGEMAELLSFCRPDHGLLTSIGESHLAALGDLESVAVEKSRLLDQAPGLRFATSAAMANLPPAVAARTREVKPQFGADGTLRFAGLKLRLPWPGRAMAHNALLALELATALGFSAPEAFARMAAAELQPGRLQHVVLEGLTIIDDSYNSNPLSAALALEVLREAPGPRVAILGDMRELGHLSEQRHLELGSATVGLDTVIAIGAEAAAMARTNPKVLATPDAAGAISLIDQIPRGATVLVKGSRSLGLERVVAALSERTW